MNYELTITQSNGTQVVHPLTTSEVTVGSDTASTIYLPGEPKLLSNHILIAPRRDQCWIATASNSPVWDEQGQAIEAQFVPWGSTLSLGDCHFQLQTSETKEKSKKDQKARNLSGPTSDKSAESSKPSPFIIMLLVSIISYVGFDYLTSGETVASSLSANAPSLFADAYECNSNNAMHRATLAEDEAIAKSERAVFEKQDGVTAVGLFAEAEACYRQAKQQADAKRMGNLSNKLREEISEEYKLLRMRLRRALAENDTSLALFHVRQVLALVRHLSEDDYTLALKRLELNLSKEQLP